MTVWNKLSNQIFLGNDDFVQSHLARLNEADNLADIPKKQRRAVAKSLSEHEQTADRPNLLDTVKNW